MNTESVLVIILGQTRCHSKTYDNINHYLLQPLNADLAICIGIENNYDYNNPFYKNSKYKFTIKEPDDWGTYYDEIYNTISQNNNINIKWRDLLQIGDQWLGGIRDTKHQHPGSAGILIALRWFLLEMIKKKNLTNKYTRFIITRSDFIYTLPHPSLQILDSKYIWIPNGEHYGGYTDRHVVISNSNIKYYLNIIEHILTNSTMYEELLKVNTWNLEQIIKLHLHLQNKTSLIRHFPYIMYSIKINMSETSLHTNAGILHNGIYIKYETEFESAIYHLNKYIYLYCDIYKYDKLYYVKYGHMTDLHSIKFNDINKFYKIINTNHIDWSVHSINKLPYLLCNYKLYLFNLNNFRIRYYLGSLNDINNLNLDNYKTFDNLLYNIDSWETLFADKLKQLLVDNSYYDKRFKFNYTFGDINEYTNNYSFVKNRKIGDTKSIVLYSLQVYNNNIFYYLSDIPYEQKFNKVCWRGKTTGSKSNSANRFNLVSKYFHSSSIIDVGFSEIVQGQDAYKKYIKTKLSIDNLLQYKYLISVEGNDVDTDLNWKLASNSLVMMARPRFSSWFMEDMLIPNYHYLLLKDDFSDLLEKIEWCNDHQPQVQKIIKHANTFVEMFKNYELEYEIEKEVLRLYFEKII